MGRGSSLSFPYAESGRRLIRRRSLPRLGIFPEFRQISLFIRAGAKEKALPLEHKIVTEDLLDLLQTNCRNIAPGSDIV